MQSQLSSSAFLIPLLFSLLFFLLIFAQTQQPFASSRLYSLAYGEVIYKNRLTNFLVYSRTFLNICIDFYVKQSCVLFFISFFIYFCAYRQNNIIYSTFLQYSLFNFLTVFFFLADFFEFNHLSLFLVHRVKDKEIQQ